MTLVMSLGWTRNFDETADGDNAEVRGAINTDDSIRSIETNHCTRGTIIIQQLDHILFGGLNGDQVSGGHRLTPI